MCAVGRSAGPAIWYRGTGDDSEVFFEDGADRDPAYFLHLFNRTSNLWLAGRLNCPRLMASIIHRDACTRDWTRRRLVSLPLLSALPLTRRSTHVDDDRIQIDVADSSTALVLPPTSAFHAGRSAESIRRQSESRPTADRANQDRNYISYPSVDRSNMFVINRSGEYAWGACVRVLWRWCALTNNRAIDDQAVCCCCGWYTAINPLTPNVAIWVHLWSILCQTGLSRHL